MLWKQILSVKFRLLLLVFTDFVEGHGRLRVPPGRSTLWREGYHVPINYDDNQLFCGGFWRHQYINRGNCGVCGDPWNAYPRQNEPPLGLYANGIISRTYRQGDVIEAVVEITANHKGYFEFRICPHNNIYKPVSKECLDKNLLQIKGSGTKFYIDKQGSSYSMILQLPPDMTCEQCVLQWRYRTGNSWGCDEPPDGIKGAEQDCGLGKGPQEEFYACADIRILPSDSKDTNVKSSERTTMPDHITTNTMSPTTSSTTITTSPPPPPTTTSTMAPTTSSTSSTTITSPPSPPTTPTTRTTTNERTTTQKTQTKIDPNTPVCISTEQWKGQKKAMDFWCMVNCHAYCPENYCVCTTVAFMGYAMVEAIDKDAVIGHRSCRDQPAYHTWCSTHCPFKLCPKGLCYPLQNTIGFFENRCLYTHCCDI